ncbi:7980_t:CDS:2 [Diversispora eburnea]|uniref:7980_t:CDS:1 n=1 Tax=Diversispora eburnea TaxID=1213867 RepID=A0A9N9F239_9GLOM|nr:7980_t:CDS:2 [Diversispora eburnea]
MENCQENNAVGHQENNVEEQSQLSFASIKAELLPETDRKLLKKF